jgi:hypothetical protein
MTPDGKSIRATNRKKNNGSRIATANITSTTGLPVPGPIHPTTPSSVQRNVGTCRTSPPSLLTSSSMPEQPSIPGVYSPPMRQLSQSAKRVRRLQYDPCCTDSGKVLTSFDLDNCVLTPNRKRAVSEYGLGSSPTSHGAVRRNRSDDLNNTSTPASNKSNNRRRALSGPLVGTTVLIGNLSRDNMSDASSDETVSSIESLKAFEQPKPMAALAADHQKIHSPAASKLPPVRHPSPISASRRKRNTSPVRTVSTGSSTTTSFKRSSSLLQLPYFFSGSRRRRSAHISNSPQSHDIACLTGAVDARVVDILPVHNSRLHIQRRWFIHLLATISICIILISGENTPSADVQPQAVKKDLVDNRDIRTVKNFSGEWFLTLTDSAEEVKNSNVRKKRQPHMAEANSLSTQHLSSPLESKKFVLTDDEIKKRTSLEEDESFGKYRHSESLKRNEATSGLVIFAWVCLVLIGLDAAWREVTRRCQHLKLQMRRTTRDLPIRFAPPHRTHSHAR